MKNYTDNEVKEILNDSVDAIFVVSSKEDLYKSIKISKRLEGFVEKEGSYKELLKKLCFHLSDNNGNITEEYQVFLPKIGEFNGRVAQKVSLIIDGENHLVQMLAYPVKDSEGDYVILLCDLDKTEYERNVLAENKVKAIQETYLFSMYVDLNKDVSSSINVSEISNDDMHYDVKYSEWRMMIVNMFLPEDQEMFLKKSDPEYLKSHLRPGKSFSFDCQMKNLEGEFIWVKLIFGRTDTTSEQDFRFVFMVENIHESSLQLFEELKKFENLASHDALTGVFNHGRIETELGNAIDDLKNESKPLYLMMFDIDWFKKINDNFGHAVGDDVLKEFVKCICDKLAGHNIKIGRWGGEEFVCVCYDLEIEEVSEIAEEIRAFIAAKIFDTIGNMTCSVGLANVNKNDSVKDAFKRLDEALYEAKSNGRNCIAVRLI